MRLSLRDVFTALGDAAPAVGAKLEFSGVSTDTRTLKAGDLFVALVGGNADGHEFIPQAIRAGAAGVTVGKDVVASRDIPVIRVPDTEVAYGQLARFWRDKFAIPVVGVTGSVGKTTVKEILAAALSPLGPVLKTEASQNNETGVPKTLLQLNETHKAAVIEMGMRGRGQIEYLCGIARPTVGVVTVISDTHIELLGTRDAIADAKGELIDALPADGLAVLNADDPYFGRMQARAKCSVSTYGVRECADFFPADVARTPDGWRFAVNGTPVEIATPSRHDIGNALAAFAVAHSLGVPDADIARALRSYAPPPMRMQIVRVGDFVILNDAYNAAPASVRSALETLTNWAGGRKIAFLGDMRELGERAESAHRELADATAGLDALYTVGGLAAQIPHADARFADSAEAAKFAGASLSLAAGDVVLVKGSRAMAMEKIADALAARGEAGK